MHFQSDAVNSSDRMAVPARSGFNDMQVEETSTPLSLRFFLNTGKKLRLSDYSVRKLFTGFLTAVRIDWYPTVIIVSKIMATPAITNTFASMDIR
jgi:hypothetical protein